MSIIKKILSRRKFIKRIIYFIVTLEVIYVFSRLLKKGTKADVTGKLFDAGNADKYEKDRIYPFSSGHFYLSRLEDGGFLAISSKCTHLGCTVRYNTGQDRFVCPCHASAFNKYGEVLAPPATRALDIYPITIERDRVFVNTFEPIKRKAYKRSQLIYS